MIKVWILTATMAGGFTQMPMVDEAACNTAKGALPTAVVQSAECYPIEMIEHGSVLAPEMAPTPPPKPGMNA